MVQNTPISALAMPDLLVYDVYFPRQPVTIRPVRCTLADATLRTSVLNCRVFASGCRSALLTRILRASREKGRISSVGFFFDHRAGARRSRRLILVRDEQWFIPVNGEYAPIQAGTFVEPLGFAPSRAMGRGERF